jgi:hypothetical protein
MNTRIDELRLRLRLDSIRERLQVLDRSLGVLKRGHPRHDRAGKLAREKIILMVEHDQILDELARTN